MLPSVKEYHQSSHLWRSQTVNYAGRCSPSLCAVGWRRHRHPRGALWPRVRWGRRGAPELSLHDGSAWSMRRRRWREGSSQSLCGGQRPQWRPEAVPLTGRWALGSLEQRREGLEEELLQRSSHTRPLHMTAEPPAPPPP